MPNNEFVGELAARYDADLGPMADPETLRPMLDRLEQLAADGPVLEFAVGTGRVALPLRERGLDVHGIELSEDMVAVLRSKPGGADLPVTVGDMATTRLDRDFSLVFLVFNTIGNLLTQDEQVECFRNAAAQLRPGGVFVVEVGVPSLRRLPPGQLAAPFEVTEEHLGFDTFDLVSQHLTSHHFRPDGDGRYRAARTRHRYVWPAELDLMARLAGLELRHRWADWDGAPFTSESTTHVSVWSLGVVSRQVTDVTGER